MAGEFLAPIPAEDDLARELLEDILGSGDTQDSNSASVPLDGVSLDGLAWWEFEALVAVLAERKGGRSTLTPRTRDGGVDVIVASASDLELIQAKHTQSAGLVDQDVVAQMVSTFDAFRAEHLRFLPIPRPIRVTIATNGDFTQRAREYARVRDVHLNGRREVLEDLESSRVNLAEVRAADALRLSSMAELQGRLLSF